MTMISRTYEANPEIFKQVFPEGKPEKLKAFLKGAVTSPEVMKIIVDMAISDLKAIPEAEFKAAIIAIKEDNNENAVSKIFTEIFGNIVKSTKKLLEDSDFVKSASSSFVKKEIVRLANDDRFKKIMKEFAKLSNQCENEIERPSNMHNEIKNPEGKKLAQRMIKQVHLLSASTFKEKLAKVWEAIKAFFQKLFCCCKKKTDEEKANAKSDKHKTEVVEGKSKKREFTLKTQVEEKPKKREKEYPEGVTMIANDF